MENGIHIPIVETSNRRLEVTVSPSYLKFTQINKGKASIGSKGEIVNYGGQGLPFPDVTPDDPQAGTKAAWNWEYKHFGDTAFNSWTYWLVDSKKNVKTLRKWYRYLAFANRTDLDPKPTLGGNTEKMRYNEVTGFSEPFASKGLAQLTVKYEDTSRARDI